MRTLTLSILIFSIALAAPPQDALRPIVVDSQEKELRRTAYRLRIPVEQLRNARRALEEATDTAERLQPNPPNELWSLGWLWLYTHRSAALARLQPLVAKLRSRAEESIDPADYHSATTAAWSLLSAVVDLDAGPAIDFLRRWPKPQKGPSELPADQRAWHIQRENALARLVSLEPDAAAALLDDLGGPAAFSFRLRAQLAAKLHFRGQKEKALALAISLAPDMAHRSLGDQDFFDYKEFLRNLARFDPDRAITAFQALGRVKGAAGVRMTPLSAGDREIDLTPGEAAQLEVLRDIRRRPEFALRALAAAPDLSAKVAAAGGLDRVLARSSSVMPADAVRISQGVGGYMVIGANRVDPALVVELRGKASGDPAYVRRRLTESSHDVTALLALSQRVASDDLDLAMLAIERAAKLVPGVQPLESRAQSLRMLLAVSRQLGLERDRVLFEQGFVLLDEMMEASPEPPSGDRALSEEQMRAARLYSAAEALETTLVKEYAWVDFESALRFTRSLPDRRRFRCLVRIAEALKEVPTRTPGTPPAGSSPTDTPERELRRTADRLRISAERLRSARSALAEATELFLRRQPIPNSFAWPLASEWMRLDPRSARERVEAIYRALALAAEESADAGAYARLTSSARILLVRLADLDAVRAADLVRAWPAPAAGLGESAAAARANLETGFREQTLPESGAVRASTPMRPEPLAGTSRPNYSSRARAAEQWKASGRREEASRLIAESIGDFENRKPDPQLVNDFGNFIQQILREPDFALEAAQALARVARTAKADNGFAGEIRVGDRSVAITGYEGNLFRVLKDIYGQPELTATMLALFPELKVKLASIGGLDNLLDPDEATGGWVSMKYDGGRNSWGVGQPLFPDRGLAAELKDKALANPAIVRERLRAEFTTPERLEALLEFARHAGDQDAELGSIALEVARDLVRRVPLERRGAAFMRLAETWRLLEGSVEADLIREGFDLVDAQRRPASPESGAGSSAQSLEDFLVAFSAFDDFDVAARRIRTLPDSSRKIAIWLQVIRYLGQAN